MALENFCTESVAIRPARYGDLPALARILGELFAIETDFSIDPQKQMAGLEKLYSQDDVDILVGECAGEVVAMVTMQRVVSTATGGYAGLIEDLVVSQPFRGAGIGTRIFDAILETARTHGYVRVQLAADTDNAPALAFYRNRGFLQSRMNLFYCGGACLGS